jgi:4-amino-4-deoxy-L-arabinose transferase-like glycosyltransferase
VAARATKLPPAAATPLPGTPVPATVILLDRLAAAVSGRRRKPAILAALSGVLVVLAALVALGVGTGSATTVLLAVLILVVVGATLAVTLLVMLLARQNHAEAYRLEDVLLRNRTALRDRTTKLGERLRAVEEAQARLPFAADYLEAMAAANASASARITDQLEQLTDR